MPADVPWVPDRASAQVEMDRVTALVGRSVAAVRYVELEYELPEPLWPGPEFDALDFGLELDLDGGATWSFAWLQAGPNEGVLAYPGTLKPTRLVEEAPTRAWDVSAESGWPGIIGPPIETVEVAWEHRAALCSRSWVLRFIGDREVVITLGDRDPEGRFVPFSPNNLAVFFSVETARRHGALVPGG